jgi:hypothetical protein
VSADGGVREPGGGDAGPAQPSAEAGQSDGGSQVVLTGTPIVATAALGTGEPVLGTTADRLFNQVNGNPIFKARLDTGGKALMRTPVNQVVTAWIQTENTTQLAANLAGWGLASASLSASNTMRYMSMRAYQIDYYEDVDLTMPTNDAPPNGVYFVSKLYFGHSYEALFSGEQSTLTAGVAATLTSANGSIQATASQYGITASNVGRGLVPVSGDAIFATSPSAVMASYRADGPAVPIYVEYRLTPGLSEPPGTPIPWVSSTAATISIDEIDVFHNGSYFDASNTSWSITADCKVNSAVVDTNDRVWDEGSVTAGGSKVASDGSGPQDPNTASPTSTYGRYASLPWSHSIPVGAGNTVECDLSGFRTDKSPQVALPPVILKVAQVDPTSNVDARAGNYDPGTGLDYQVHYTVSYKNQ